MLCTMKVKVMFCSYHKFEIPLTSVMQGHAIYQKICFTV
jgi:hypothetical protein